MDRPASGLLERDTARRVARVVIDVLLDPDGERVVTVPFDRPELVDRRQPTSKRHVND